MSLYVFMTAAVAFIVFGYNQGLRTRTGGYYGKISSKKLYRISVTIVLGLFLPTLMWRTTSISVFEVILDPGAAYVASHNVADVVAGKTAWVEYIRILLSAYMLLLIPLLVIHWSRLSKWERFFGLVAILSEVFLAIAIGTNKGFGDVFIYVFWAFLIKNRGAITKRMVWSSVRVILPLLLILGAFFTQGQIGRNNGAEVSSTVYAAGINVERDHFLIRYLPQFTKEGAIALTSYMVQGYHGLALCLEQPFVFTWGVGNSRFLTSYADKYLGTQIEYQTYPMRTELVTGWDSRRYWQTIFPWFASDFTFFGSILVLGAFSFLMAMSWRDSLVSSNPYAASMFLQFALMFTYLPANNQVMQSGPGVVGFFVTLIFWLYTRQRKRFRLR